MTGCFCFRDVLEALANPTPLPASKRPESRPETAPDTLSPIADINSEGSLEDQLLKAVNDGNLERIVCLVDAGADPSLPRYPGAVTALSTAASQGRHDIFAMLLASATGIHARNDSRLDLHFSH